MSYRNCVYSSRTKSIHLWTWDSVGERVYQELPFKPYLYLEDKKGPDTSIYDTKLAKREFETGWDRNKFIENCGIKRLFENLPPHQQFLVDNYYHNCSNDDFSQFPLRVMFLDIECPNQQDGKKDAGFPDRDNPEHVIDLITVYDNFDGTYYTFGLKPYYHNSELNIVYEHCLTEEELLKKFIKFFRRNYPDVLCGWNSANFDIPYLINRISTVLSDEWVKKLSPIGSIYEKINKEGKFGMPSSEYVIDGISCLDYYILYQKFSMDKLESYKLDFVAEHELNKNKVEYEGSLEELCKTDWNRYVDYNIRDVEILVELDEKLRYLELIRFISYLGLCKMEEAIMTVRVINGAVAIRARHRNQKIPTFVRPLIVGKIPGAFVADPKIGFRKNIVSFDANSLYPSVMISLNMSPETKIGKVSKENDIYTVKHISGRTFEMTKENFAKFLQEEQAALSKANILFSQKKKGLMPEFLDWLYAKRKEMKGNMFILKKQSTEGLTEQEKLERKKTIQKYDTFQHAYKIVLNSTYGYCANKFAPLGDDDIGSSVTLTGQAAIKKSADLFKNYIQLKIQTDMESEIEKYYVYSDTDSIYISLDFDSHMNFKLLDADGNITSEFFEVCDEIENMLNTGMNEWARKSFRSKDPRFIFKREAICDNGLFLKKKYYVLHMLDDEGTQVNKFKYKGVDVVKTTMPKAIKPSVRKTIETMIMTQSLAKTNEHFLESYELFKDLGPDKVYKNSGINNYEKYSKMCSGFQTGKGIPGHVKAAYFHDRVVEDLKLESKYEKFKSGDKVKSVYLKTPNKYNIDVIGFKGSYPKEFLDIFEIDFEKMFGKILYAPIERFFDAVNWVLRKPNENVKVELEDIFG